MIYLKYKIHNESIGEKNVSVSNEKNQYTFNYPCISTFECTYYEITLEPAVYRIELYGASGGYNGNYITAYKVQNRCPDIPSNVIKRNVECNLNANNAGAGGYTSGLIKISHKTNAFLFIGGSGQYTYKIEERDNNNCYKRENMIEGGYNGGGWASNFYGADTTGSGSGGGATDLRFDEPDLFHRVIVAGGGGGTDDQAGTGRDDGSGGAGGGLTAQSFYFQGIEDTGLFASQDKGFSFGYGESAQQQRSKHSNGKGATGASDKGGAGGGWFGGFASHSGYGGAGGGSSFVLTEELVKKIPQEEITSYNSFYDEGSKQSQKYAFLDVSEYYFQKYLMASGVWAGNGFAIITIVTPTQCTSHHHIFITLSNIFVFIVLLR